MFQMAIYLKYYRSAYADHNQGYACGISAPYFKHSSFLDFDFFTPALVFFITVVCGFQTFCAL